MTSIAQDYDALAVNRLVQANLPVCSKSKYDDFNRKCGINKPTGFVLGPNLKIERHRFPKLKCACHKDTFGLEEPDNSNYNFLFLILIILLAYFVLLKK